MNKKFGRKKPQLLLYRFTKRGWNCWKKNPVTDSYASFKFLKAISILYFIKLKETDIQVSKFNYAQKLLAKFPIALNSSHFVTFLLRNIYFVMYFFHYLFVKWLKLS